MKKVEHNYRYLSEEGFADQMGMLLNADTAVHIRPNILYGYWEIHESGTLGNTSFIYKISNVL